VSIQSDGCWSFYGKSLTAVDSCPRHFTGTLNRARVFESAITRILQQPDRDAANVTVQPEDVTNSGRFAVLLNCPVLSHSNMQNMTATQLRQLLVSQHIHCLLTDPCHRSLSIVHCIL